MIYGRDYDSPRRECSNCGTFTSVFSYCYACDMTICEGCDHTCVPEFNVELNEQAA
jgi:hypothetical protein